MMRVGLIGLGIHGLRYAKHVVDDVPGLELVAVCRRDAVAVEQVAQQFGVRGFTDDAALIDSDDVEGVILVTPPPAHLPQAQRALERGKAVLLEKPLTWTLAEAHTLRDVVQRTNGKLFLAQSLRYSKSLRMAAQEMGQLGTIRSFSASQRLPRTNLVWQNSATPHPMGSILNTGVHLYDLVRWMLGAEFESVTTVARRIENPDQEDLFKTLATLQGCDTLVALEIAKSTDSRSSNLEIVGEHGQLWVDYQMDSVTLVRGTDRTVLREPGMVYTIPLLLADWARAVQQGAPMPITVDDGVRTMEVVEASYASVARGQRQNVTLS